jgi:hypothetical protein
MNLLDKIKSLIGIEKNEEINTSGDKSLIYHDIGFGKTVKQIADKEKIEIEREISDEEFNEHLANDKSDAAIAELEPKFNENNKINLIDFQMEGRKTREKFVYTSDNGTDKEIDTSKDIQR